MILGFVVICILCILRHRDPMELNQVHRTYLLVYDLVNQLNRCFGPILLVLVIFFFIWTINGSFHVIIGFREKGTDVGVMTTLAVQLVVLPYFLSMLYIPNRIKMEVF